MAPNARTLNQAFEQAIQRKVNSYRTWREMGICHADAVDSILQNSTWGPELLQKTRARCEALSLN